MSLRRVLIANRGEISVRIARACREAGIESVAVHTDADAGAFHVTAADRAVSIGAANAYLSVDALIAAAHSSGADALHPGYGFLSERAALAPRPASSSSGRRPTRSNGWDRRLVRGR
jgi:acetyl/propionyl-CoA carboxylase alpha subunit